jgi:hypothetical protein
MKLLTMIENSLNNLINYLDDYEENQSESKITNMLDDIYERLDIVKKNHKHNYLEKFIYLFDDIVDGFRTAEKYLYFSPLSYYPLMNIKPGDFVDDEGETENESDSPESDNKSDDESSGSESGDESNNETVTDDNELKID